MFCSKLFGSVRFSMAPCVGNALIRLAWSAQIRLNTMQTSKFIVILMNHNYPNYFPQLQNMLAKNLRSNMKRDQ